MAQNQSIAESYIQALVVDGDTDRALGQARTWDTELRHHIYLTRYHAGPEVRVTLNGFYEFTALEVDRVPVELDPPSRDRVIHWLQLIDPRSLLG